MPVIDTTRGNAGKSKPKPKRKYTPPPSRSDAAQGTGAKPTPRRTSPNTRYTPPPTRSDAAQRSGAKPVTRRTSPNAAPQGTSPSDAAVSGGAHGRKRASAYRRSAAGIAEKWLNGTKKEKAALRKGTKKERKTVRALERYFASKGREGDRPYTDAEREQVDVFKKGKAYKDALARTKLEREVRDNPDLPDYQKVTDPKKIRAMGFTDPGFLDTVATAPAYAAKAGAATAVATYHDPVGVPLKTAKQGLQSIPALPSAVADAVLHPEKAVKESVAGIGERGKETFGEQVKRIRKEGALNDIADAAVIVPATGAAAGLAGKVLTKAIPNAPGVKPRSGRAAVRVSGNVVKERPDRIGSVRYALGKATDEVRARSAERQVRRAEADPHKKVDVLVRQAVESNRKAGRVVEVAPISSKVRNLKITNKVAQARARGVLGLKHDLRIRDTAARKLINRLSKKEKKAFYYAAVFGIRSPEQAVDVLGPLKTKIEAQRKAEGFEPRGGEKAADMLPDIDALLKDPAGSFTTKLGETVDAITPDSLRAAREDPRYNLEQTNARRFKPLEEALDLERGVIKNDMPRLYHGSDKGPDTIMRDGLRAGKPDLEGMDDPTGVYLTPIPEAARSYGRYVYEVDPSKVDDLQAFRAGEYTAPGNIAADALRFAGRANDWGKLKLDIKDDIPALRYFDESHADYLKRVRATVKDKGLARPLYFRSERYADEPGFGDRAVGGINRMKVDPAYKGSNLRRGIQDTGVEVYLRGLARNTKAKHNKKLVDDLLEDHAIAEYNSRPNVTLTELRDDLARDQATGYAFWNPGIYRETLRRVDEADSTRDLGVEHGEAKLAKDALDAATNVDAPGAAEIPGWKVVPEAALKELQAQMQPSNAAGRTYDIGKGLTSRMILLTGNIPWLGAQVVQNALGGAAATGGRVLLPHNWVGAKKRWNALTPEQKQEVGGILGLDATAADANLTRMGAHGGGFTQSYRQLKDWIGSAHLGTAVGAKARGPQLRAFSPIQAMAKMDRAQNNAARIAVWHTLEKKASIKKLSDSANRMQRVQAKVMRAFESPEATRRLLTDRDSLDEIGDTVTKFMGDFATLNSYERKFLGRAVMFYPFVRFSTRLLFYTLPVEHPAVAGLIAQLTLAKAEDLEELYGPKWAFHGGELQIPGTDKVIDLKKLNPVANSVFEGLAQNRLDALIGIVPPFIGMAANQTFLKDYYTGKDLKISGKAAPYGGLKLPITAGEARGRILANDVLSLSAAYRAAMNLEVTGDPDLHGTQGDDSLLWSPRPIHYKGDDDVAKKQAKFAKINEEFEEENESLISEMIPFFPEDSDAAERERQRLIIERMDKPKSKKKSGGYDFGGSSSSGYKFGSD